MSLVKAIVIPWSSWWFMAVYLILWGISPYINKMVYYLSNRELIELSTILLIISCIQGFLFKGGIWGTEFSFAQGFTMYIFGVLISKFNVNRKLSISLIYFFSSTLLQILLLCIPIVFIQDRVYSYNNPIVVVQAYFLFCIFRALPQIKVNNMFLSKFLFLLKDCVLIVYLLTDYSGMRQFIFRPMIFLIKYTDVVILSILLYSLFLLLVSIPICILLNKVNILCFRLLDRMI